MEDSNKRKEEGYNKNDEVKKEKGKLLGLKNFQSIISSQIKKK